VVHGMPTDTGINEFDGIVISELTICQRAQWVIELESATGERGAMNRSRRWERPPRPERPRSPSPQK
jgi:hypothetical protein